MERIFVQIASYRDPELQSTLEDLFVKAADPNRIFVGLCLQWIPELDQACTFNASRNDQVRCIRIQARESLGVCWARHLTQKVWEGEEFTLQIDSHMRFEEHWDEKMISALRVCPSKKAVLSTYPAHYDPPGNLMRGYISSIIPSHFDEWNTLCLKSAEILLEKAPSSPIPGTFCGTCFIFGPSDIISEVPYDPHVYFFGEEVSMSVRLWTKGWDIFHPNIPLVYHNWKREYRPAHWEDVPRAEILDRKSRKRVNHLLGIETGDTDSLVDLERYGLGTIRTLEEYQEFSGIDFAVRSLIGFKLLPRVPDGEFKTIQPFFW